MYEDTYFLNQQEALRIASEQNRYNEGYTLQVCYYEGEKIEADLVNLIQLPIETLVDSLANGIYRIPTKIDFTGLELSELVRLEVELNFNISIEQAKALRNELNLSYLDTLKNTKLDFDDKLRFYFIANENSRVMQHMSKNIAKALEKKGYDVFIHVYFGIEDNSSLKTIAEFNPHATVNINHLENKYIGDDVFNFVWVQDYFAIEQFSKIEGLRERDYIFHLIEHLGNNLRHLNVKSQHQSFCIDTDMYKSRKGIKRTDKIVMIGTSYKKSFDAINHSKKNEVAEILLNDYVLGTHKISDGRRKYFSDLREEFNLTEMELGKIARYIERDGLLLYIDRMKMSCELEIYGWYWEEYPQLKDSYKGVLSYGEEISKVYNSAKYTLVLGGYPLQQRTLEAAASGCIPLVYDSRYNGCGRENAKCFKESLVFFKKPNDILSLLDKEHSLDLNCIVKVNSYGAFVDKMLCDVKNNLND